MVIVLRSGRRRPLSPLKGIETIPASRDAADSSRRRPLSPLKGIETRADGRDGVGHWVAQTPQPAEGH